MEKVGEPAVVRLEAGTGWTASPQRLAPGSVDFILTDPPYLVRYRDRSGRTVANDNRAGWLKPAYAGMHRVLKDRRPVHHLLRLGCRTADSSRPGTPPVSASSVTWCSANPMHPRERYLRNHHEQAFLLAKGDAPYPHRLIADVMPWDYTGNILHPTQKPVRPLQTLVETFTRPGELVLDPFCGSGSTLVAAKAAGRDYLGIELDRQHRFTAAMRANITEAA